MAQKAFEGRLCYFVLAMLNTGYWAGVAYCHQAGPGPQRSRQEGQVTVKSTRSLQQQQLRSVGGDISHI